MVWTGESLTCILEESLPLPFLCALPFRGNIIGPDVILCKGHLIRKHSKQKQGSSTHFRGGIATARQSLCATLLGFDVYVTQF